jgi:RNA recognition motif-containing protein
MKSLRTEHALLVDGFPLSYAEDDLKRVFAPYGNVGLVQIIRDPMGMSLGFGYVALTSENELQAALAALNGKPLYERPLIVIRSESVPLPRRA